MRGVWSPGSREQAEKWHRHMEAAAYRQQHRHAHACRCSKTFQKFYVYVFCGGKGGMYACMPKRRAKGMYAAA